VVDKLRCEGQTWHQYVPYVIIACDPESCLPRCNYRVECQVSGEFCFPPVPPEHRMNCRSDLVMPESVIALARSSSLVMKPSDTMLGIEGYGPYAPKF
jgi:hypothetical protein